MYKGSNPSAIRSRDDIVKAFLACLEETPLDKLSITAIMDRTGLSRQTFYQIFRSKDEVLEFCLDTIFSDFVRHAETTEIGDLCSAAKLFFAFFETHRDLLGCVVKNGKSCVLQKKCIEYLQSGAYLHYELKGARSGTELEYAASFVISGMVAMLERWLKEGGESLRAQDLADLICRITGAEAEGR